MVRKVELMMLPTNPKVTEIGLIVVNDKNSISRKQEIPLSCSTQTRGWKKAQWEDMGQSSPSFAQMAEKKRKDKKKLPPIKKWR